MTRIAAAVAATVVAACLPEVVWASDHVLTITEPVLHPEDGPLLGNGDLSVSVYQTRDKIVWRFGKGDVWDRRLDRNEDPVPPHIKEIAHGIAVEGWKCPPYGTAPPVALHGTDNPERMKELCKGAPPSYVKRPYPCPKPVGELALHLPPDLPRLSIRQELSIEEAVLRVTCSSALGVEIRLECFIPPRPNALVVDWEVVNWTKETEIGHTKPPVWFSLYRWADPPLRAFAERYFAEYGHDAFIRWMDHAKVDPLPSPKTRTLDGRWAVEQSFPPDPTFPKGFSYLMAPFCSEADAVPIDMASNGEARLRLMPDSKSSSGRLVVLVSSSSDPGGAEAELQRVSALVSDSAEAVQQAWEDDCRRDAAEFWAHSALECEDKRIENLWYETFHARRCTTRAGKTPPGLFLPSTVRDFSHWHGDYHSNYNYQQPFWGDYVANQLELGDAYFTGMEYLLQMGRIIAERYYGTRGVFIQLSGYPILAEDDVLGAVPMGRMAYMTGWAASHYWARYLYTKDVEWLRKLGYPVLRDCALFYTDFAKKGDDGLYHVFPSNQGEDGFTGDPADYTDRGQVMRHMRHCLRSAIQASEVLEADANLRTEWREVLDHAAGDDGVPPVKREGLEKYFLEANPPEFGVGVPYKPRTAKADAPPWPGAGQWFDHWYAGQYPLMAMPNLRHGALDPMGAYRGVTQDRRPLATPQRPDLGDGHRRLWSRRSMDGNLGHLWAARGDDAPKLRPSDSALPPMAERRSRAVHNVPSRGRVPGKRRLL